MLTARESKGETVRFVADRFWCVSDATLWSQFQDREVSDHDGRVVVAGRVSVGRGIRCAVLGSVTHGTRGRAFASMTPGRLRASVRPYVGHILDLVL